MTDSIPYLHKYQVEVGSLDENTDVFTPFSIFETNHIKGTFSSSSKGSGTSSKDNALHIYNLEEETRQALTRRRAYIKVSAGWESLTSFDEPLLVIYTGHVKSIKTTKTNVDTITELILEDGLFSKKNTINKIINQGATLQRALEALVKGFAPQQAVVDIGKEKSVIQLPRGKTFNGNVSEVLDKMCRNYGLKWYITNNTVKVVDADNLGTKSTNIKLNLNTIKGFIDYSKQNIEIKSKDPEKLEAKVTLQLNPLVTVGDIITIPKPDNAGGETLADFKVNSVTHKLDFFGHTWDTIVEAQETGD